MPSLPSPASSPSLDPADPAAQQPSRKRQRSRSMQSDKSSSSIKRSTSDATSLEPAVRSPNSDQMSSLTLVDINQEIDSYMAEQGEAETQPFPSPTPPQDTTASETMSPPEKLAQVGKRKGKQMEVGETWYVLSRSWWKRWHKACSGIIDKEGAIDERDVGPVNNSDLLDTSGKLIPDIVEGIDAEFVPSDVWDSLVQWYGPVAKPISGRIILRGGSTRTTFLELHPPQIKVFRLSRDSPQNLGVGLPYPLIQVSIADTVQDLCTKVADAVKVDKAVHTPYRVWKPENNPDDWRAVDFPTANMTEAAASIVEESQKTLEDEGIEAGDIFIVEFKQPDGWLMDNSATSKPVLAIEGPQPLFSSKGAFFNRMGTTTTSYPIVKSTNDFYSGFGSKSPSSIALSNGKSYAKTLEPGALGLGNMGNTCFMNSALQCLAHTKELSDYFLSGVFKDELNRDNPLGMHGAIADAFGSLLERIWANSGPSTSYSPRDFKQQLQRFAPQFSGYQQHDSQELVAFLLDGLHEDLNRVLKKPYVEKPDWEGGGDLELVKLAEKSWEGYMMRNDSVIVDLFQGQYQSTLVCPECSKVSITFDPFMYLTLPLPVQKKWKHTIYYVPWDLERPHVKVPVELNRDGSFRDLRNLLGRWMDTVPENLLTMEIFQHKFYKSLDDTVSLGDMTDSDTIVCFELPCNAQQNRTYKKRTDDPFVVPLFLSDAKGPAARSTYITQRNSPLLFGYPTVVVIDQRQATDVDAIYDAVVARLQRWTANARDLYYWEVGSSDSMDEVSIPITGFPPIESVTEITEDGDVVTVQAPLEEGDIVDEKGMLVDEENDVSLGSNTPRAVRTKKDIFNLRLQSNHKEFGTTYTTFASNRWESWDRRIEEADTDGILMRDGDAFYCEFDENMKAYFFGEGQSFEHALWDTWEEFVHPEYTEAKKAGAQKQRKGISLEDCLEEFVKEEQLGEDDLWYCPRCKKHQQATKKFDLWKAPDILVVHLKRFSNSRTLRDKIDTLIDFPVEGLDLGDKVGERAAAKRLLEQGVDLEELMQLNLDEPLVYDLFGVDEHMGGLGGGHYRAYASNHLTGKWYHFDDAYVSPAQATDAVNANAYLLFYRRRTSKPLGGKTYQKAMQHHAAPDPSPEPSSSTGQTQLPTPPNEPRNGHFNGPADGLSPFAVSDHWKLRSDASNPGSSVPSPPAEDPPDFEEAQTDALVSESYESAFPFNHHYNLRGFGKSSPTSSNEADPDIDDLNWGSTFVREVGDESPDWEKSSHLASPSYSETSDNNPFTDSDTARDDAGDTGVDNDKSDPTT